MMIKTSNTGSEILCKTLESLSIKHIFGLPGTQNIILFEALRRSKIHTILTTSELAASFMANGYYRSSGKIGVILTIPGPGFTYALTGIAEAFLDSVAMLCIVGKPANFPGNKFHLQAINQAEMARPIVKNSHCINHVGEIQNVIYQAYNNSITGEPGPVLVEVDNSVFSENYDYNPDQINNFSFSNPPLDPELFEKAFNLFLNSKRIVFFLGQGAIKANKEIRELVELLNAPVLTTTSGRGILPEDHYLAFPFNFARGGGNIMNEMLQSSDLIVALGCKFSHNGSGGFQYKLPREKLFHLDSSETALNANYPAKLTIQADTLNFLVEILKKRHFFKSNNIGWKKDELKKWKELAHNQMIKKWLEPKMKGIKPSNLSYLFEIIRNILPNNSYVVTDSGFHQMLVRKYYKVLNPGGLIIPADFQSMGYSIPAAIGIKLANQNNLVLAITGDGGFNISAMELLTAFREKISIKVLIFNDKHLGLIRLKQISQFGSSFATKLTNPNYKKLADALNLEYVKISGDIKNVLKRHLNSSNITIFELCLKDSLPYSKLKLKSRLSQMATKLRHRINRKI